VNIFDLLTDLNLLPLVMWLTSISGGHWTQEGIYVTHWGNTLETTGLTVSMVVNVMVTGLIVFKIFKVFRTAKGNTTSEEKSLGVTGGGKLSSIIFIIIESGMALFDIQLARVVLAGSALQTDVETEAYTSFTVIHQMLNVNISSFIVTLYFTDNLDLARA
jgi:hypothetical protein